MRKKQVFQITIDTEGDNLWSAPREIKTENARFLPRFQSLCERYGFKPTYLVNWEMANSPVFQDFGRDVIARSTGEIGMHLHAWNSPPIVPLTADDFKFAPYLIEFPIDVMREKIKVMTFSLENVFGVKMLTHRAGRWAFDEIYARLLAEFGYESDCSVTPHVSWRCAMGNPGGNGGWDYSDFPEQPFVIDLGESGGIFEVPTTIFPKPMAFFERVARKALGRPPRQWWLRPTGKNLREMLHVLDMGVACGSDYVQFMLHSSELMPGGSPTFDTAEKIERLYAHLEGLFATAASHFIGVTLSEYVGTRKADVGTAIPLRPWPKPMGGRPIPGTDWRPRAEPPA